MRYLPYLVLLLGCGSGPAGSDPGDAGPGDVDGDLPEVTTPTVDCAALVVGGGLGGIAAAEELGARGLSVCLTEETHVLGGTLTAEATPIDSLFDQMPAGFFGQPGSLESDALDVYRARYPYPSTPQTAWFNPGDCGRRQCFEPAAGAEAIETRVLPQFPSIRVFEGHVPVHVTTTGGRIASVTFQREDGTLVEMRAGITIDATDLGDLYPLANVGFRVGREGQAEFNEPAALPDAGDPECVQRMTWVLGLERTDHDSAANLIARPPGYDAGRYGTPGQEFDIDAPFVSGYRPGNTWWTWRRVLAPKRDDSHGITGARDVTSVNMFGANDFAVNRDFCGPLGCSPIRSTRAEQMQVFANARDHSLGFLYFLQNDVHRPNDVKGYWNIRLRPDAMATSDGLAAYPYIREGRRLRAIHTVTQNDMLEQSGPRFSDSIGINRYGADIKGCPPTPGTPEGELYKPVPQDTAVFMQIPFGALVPETMNGLLAGTSKNMGVSHIANASLRVHPAEWTVGRAAGVAAAIALEKGIEPRQIASSEAYTRLLQERLVTGSSRSGWITWLLDVSVGDRGQAALQMMAVSGVMSGYVDAIDGEERPTAHPDAFLTRGEAALVSTRELGITPVTQCAPSFTDVPCTSSAYGAIQALANLNILGGYSDGTFRPGEEITRAQLSKIVYLADCHAQVSLCRDPSHPPADPGYADVTPGSWFYDFVAMNAMHGYYLGADATGTTFDPGVSVTRREAAIWLFNHMRLRLGLD